MIALSNNKNISAAYSYLGHKCLSFGDVEAVKFLYGNTCYENPALIKTISLLQDCLTVNKIFTNNRNTYGDEFLYYWGMINLGWTSRLIVKNLDMAAACFEKIEKTRAKVEARLSFIDLLLSDENYKSDDNSRRLGVLREWAGKQDMFSRIILSKIAYFSFLNEKQPGDLEQLPLRALRLLEIPCHQGHPEAIKLYKAILDNENKSAVDTPSASVYNYINIACLYDY